jgi:hypothetical protein
VRVQLLAESPTRPPPEAGLKDWKWVDELPRFKVAFSGLKLQFKVAFSGLKLQFKVAFKWAEIAAKLSNSGKPIEGVWTWPALAFEGRSSMRVQGLNGYFTMFGHKGPGLDPQSLARKLEFRAASELTQFSGWNRVLSVDRELRSVMRKDYQRNQAIKAARACGWSTTNHGDKYRQEKYANPKGGKKATEQNRRTKLVQNILQRMDRGDEDEWEPPTGGTAVVASQRSAETEKRCTRRTQRERVKSSGSHVSISGPASASVLPGPEAPDSEPQSEVSESSEGGLDAPLRNDRAAPGTNDNASESSSGEDVPLFEPNRAAKKKGQGAGPAG